ncbi:MAG: hypothetical protein JWN48_2238 [Myxococcaceae bacterium]|nr:hypothetical protein [Myxococcaceae bacterium]
MSAERDGPRRFRTTRWSLVVRARGGESEDARRAFDELCRQYWYPVYAFLRQSGGAQDAADLTQQLFMSLLVRDDLRSVSPERGRFRTWLIHAAKHALANQIRYSKAQKRDVRLEESFDPRLAEQRYAADLQHDSNPEQVFDRRFGLCLLARCIDVLQGEYEGRGKGALFAQLLSFLPGPAASEQSYEPVAEALGMSVNGLKQTIFRLRRRHREIFWDAVLHTVDDPGDAAAEARAILLAVSGTSAP